LNKIIDLAADGETDWCLTMTSKSKPEKWVQFTWDSINMYYPFKESAEELFDSSYKLESANKVIAFEPNVYLTLKHSADIEQVSYFIKKYFTEKLEIDIETDLEYNIEEF